MNKIFFFSIILISFCNTVFAQDELFGTKKKEARKGFVIALNGNFDIPEMDMAKRFGVGYRVGPSIMHKSKKNWLIGIKGDFIFGNKIKEDSFLANIKSADGSYIAANGYRVSINTFERGYLIGLQAGKIINLSKKNYDNGLMLLTSAGFIQHKILIYTDKSGDVPQLKGDYRKGYDRLTNGLFIEQFVGYTYFANDGLVNFNIGLDIMAGFTQGRRDYWIDVNKPGNDKRTDMLIGIRGAWYIPIFKRKSEDYFFE